MHRPAGVGAGDQHDVQQPPWISVARAARGLHRRVEEAYLIVAVATGTKLVKFSVVSGGRKPLSGVVITRHYFAPRLQAHPAVTQIIGDAGGIPNNTLTAATYPIT